MGVGDKSWAVQINERNIYLMWGSRQDASLFYKKRVAICLPIWEGQVQAGEMKNSSLKFVCITFFGVEEKESLLEQS